MSLPEPCDNTSLVLRTDFSDDQKWQEVQGAVDAASKGVPGRKTGYRRLWANGLGLDVASRRVLEKLGFRETGRVERDAVYGDSLLTVREF